MRCALDKLVLAMLDSIMLPIAHVHDAVIRTKAVCMNGRSQINTALNNGLKTGLFAVRDDFRRDPTIAFIDAEAMVLPRAPRPRLPRTRRAPIVVIHRVQGHQRKATLSGNVERWLGG